MDKRLLIVIAGPTASGKSELAVELAEHFQTEIISADSRQCYREMSIGTAKPGADLLDRVPHHFISSHSIEVPLHAGEFATEGRKLLHRIFSTTSVAILTGGTGMYIEALIHGMDVFPSIEKSSRDQASAMLKEGGVKEACAFLSEKDPEYLKMVDRSNPARLRRAIEVIIQSGKPFSSFLNKSKAAPEFTTLMYVPEFERTQLYDRINRRVDAMMQAGLLQEVNELVPYKAHQALQTVGYKELFQYLDGSVDLVTAVELIKQHTRNYAKRQLTWFRNKGDYRFIPYENALKIIIGDVSAILH
jgi:tRNA dimethylallyltransferase